MYLSYLLIDTAAHANRPRPGRDWIRNPYRVHQRLWMAFPSAARAKDDPHFLDSFIPEEFQPRGPSDGSRFLFRMDAVPATSPSRHVITVQSAIEPNWEYAFHNAPEFLAAKPKVVDFEPSFREGQTLRFRLRANPTKRLHELSKRPTGESVDARWHGKRIGISTPDEQIAWLNRRAEDGGFEIGELTKSFSEGTVRAWKGGAFGANPHPLSLVSAFFEGRLVVRDTERFRTTLVRGIGPAKGLGFGLLSVSEL